MVKVAASLLLALVVLVIAMQIWRWTDARSMVAAWSQLAAADTKLPPTFDEALVADLPEPAARFFRFAILPGTPLSGISEIVMAGEIGLGTRDAPGYQPMRARQILAPPEGLVWRLSAGSRMMRMSGSDAMSGDRSWTRFWLLGLVPIVRAGGDADHLRASLGRVVAEAAFWTPAALLPQAGTTWEAVDADTARATVRHHGMIQTVDIRVDKDGRPTQVAIPRWSNANPGRTYRVQPFGGTLSDFRDVGGYRLPFRVEGGNFFGTDDYFPFFRAEVEAIRVLPREHRPDVKRHPP
jgi:hypothetical protein